VRLNQAAGNPRSAFQVVLDASVEVRCAVVYASFIVVLVFLPVFFLDGLAGAFFRPLALAYVLAILASLAAALTVTPALSYMLLTGRAAARPEAPLSRWLKRLYRPVLPVFAHRPSTSGCHMQCPGPRPAIGGPGDRNGSEAMAS
jgi:Cu/Ag efflux pump CusA